MNEKDNSKVYIIFSFFLLLALVVIFRAFYLQVIGRSKIEAKATRQIERKSKVYPHRGNIYDRNGDPLAINNQSYTVFTNPRYVKNKKESYKKLAEIVPELSEKFVYSKIKKRNRFTYLKRQMSLTQDQYEQLKNLAYKVGGSGIGVETVPIRTYPNNELLAQTLGFVNIDNKGAGGLEKYFDDDLRGKAQITKCIRDRKGRRTKCVTINDGTDAKDIYLTIDKDLQSVAEKTIKDAVEEFGALKAGIGVMDSSTGEILAMANYPTFDPNNYKKAPAEHRKLAFVSDPFEPGSTFKTFTVASALENKIATPDRAFYCERGKFRVQGHYIKESDSRHKYEWLSVKEILENSSNVGTTKIAFDLTFPKLKNTLSDFHIGRKTGIEVAGESRGIFTSKSNVSPLSLSNISFGQGVATTGIQILAAYSAIVNGGVYMRPTLVKGSKREPERIISKQTADQLIDMLVGVVENGTASRAKIKYFTVGGKTSTAQRPDASGGYKGYVPGFVGFPTSVDKKFVVYAYVDYPKKISYYGNRVAAPIFAKVSKYILYKEKNFSKFAETDKATAKSSSLRRIKVRKTKRFTGRNSVPNFIGLDKISAMNLAKKAKLKVVHVGIGVVKSQRPKSGSAKKDQAVVKLIYSPPSYE